ncbi:MAG: beta-galactosidase, partial [Microbacterium sp. 14-71-5]
LEVLRRLTPELPVTTNFMGFFPHADYWAWAPHVDVVSDDSYPDPADPRAHVRLAAQRDLMRSLRAGQPWLLMESAPSAVNWRCHNLPKPPGLHRVHSLQAVARGADGVLHFQWRQAEAGAEKFHSALLPHAGPDSRLFRESVALGAELAALSDDVVGARVPARVAMVFDWDSWHALSQPAVPAALDYVDTFLSWYAPFLRRGVTVDLLPRDADAARLAAYDLVVVPALHVAADDDLAALDAYVRGGGHLVVTYLSAVLDSDLHARLGGYLGSLRDTLGVRVTEIAPAGGAVALVGDVAGAAGEWNDAVELSTARVVAAYADGFAAGDPAVTRNGHGAGVGWYVGTQPSVAVLDALAARWLDEAGVPALLTEPVDGVEAVVRGGLLFVLNHTGEAVDVRLTSGSIHVPAYDVVIRPAS